MKLHHYNEAYAHMVRRAKFANGTPKPLPKPERNFQDKLKTLKNVSQGISPESRIRLLDYFIQEALTKGQLTEEQASGIYNQLQLDKDKIGEQIDDYETGNFNEGGRINFGKGTKPAYDYTSFDHKINELKAHFKRYQKMGGTLSFDIFSEAFAKENFAEGGNVRQNFSIGSDPKVQSKIKTLLSEGKNINEVAEQLGYSRSTIKRAMSAGNISPMSDLKNLITNSFNKLEKQLGRAPTLIEIEKDTGKTRQVIINNIDKTLSEGRKLEGGKSATAASQKFFKERKVDKPSPVYEGPAGKTKLTGVKFANAAQEKEYIKLLTDRYKYPKGSREGLKLLTNEGLAKKFGMTLTNVERVNRVIANEENLTYPKQTYEGTEKRLRERDEFRKENIKKTSDPSAEAKIKKNIKKINPTALADDLDIAHRASLKANANFGSKYLISSLGLDQKVVNQSLVRPTEQKLGKLYNDQQKLIKGLTPGKVPKNIQKKIETINLKVSELADRTKGVLQGVLVDEKTLVPRRYGVDYSKVLGFGLIDKPVQELTQADYDLINLNIGEQIKAAKKPSALKTFGKYAKQIARPVVRLAAPIIPFAGPAIMMSGAFDAAKAAEQGYTSPDELGAAYYLGPEAAKGLDSLKERVRGQIDETEEFVP